MRRAVPPPTATSFSSRRPRSSSVSRNGCPWTPASAVSRAASGDPPSRSSATPATAASSSGPARSQRAGRRQPGQGRALRRGRLTGPDREQPQDPVRGELPGQRAERGQRGRVGPLHVVDRDQHRRAQRGPLERLLQLPQQPEPLVGGVAEVAQDGRVDRRVGRRHQRLEQRAERDDLRGDVARAAEDGDAALAGLASIASSRAVLPMPRQSRTPARCRRGRPARRRAARGASQPGPAAPRGGRSLASPSVFASLTSASHRMTARPALAPGQGPVEVCDLPCPVRIPHWVVMARVRTPGVTSWRSFE